MINRQSKNGGRSNRKNAVVPVRPALVPVKHGTPVTHVYLSGTNDVFKSDGAHGSRFKWLISTCIAGAVGLAAIGFVMYASKDMETGQGFIASMESATRKAFKAPPKKTIAQNALRASFKKTDRIEQTAAGLLTRDIIHETKIQKRGNREFISVKPYARITARLSTAQPPKAEEIPPFNPFQIYADTGPVGSEGANAQSSAAADITTKQIDLTNGVLPAEDGAELSIVEINKILTTSVELFSGEAPEFSQANAPANESMASDDAGFAKTVELDPQTLPGDANNTTVIEKSTAIEEALESQEIKIVKIKSGDSLARLLNGVGAEKWQVRSIIDAMKEIYPAKSIKKGQTARFTLVPAPSGNNRMEPISLSLFSGNRHHVTVYRNDGGEYVASKNPLDLAVANGLRPAVSTQRATIYASLYKAALAQNIDPAKIMSLLKIYAYHVDFKQRVRPGDSFEAFYDLEETSIGEEELPRELLYTATSFGGDKRRFYRFRSANGSVDYYDENGSSSKKFLMRKPVRGARYASPFGWRKHPILGRRKMHTGADWAAPRGTPILAAGTGVVEVAGRKGGYGNYIRIRHANGYKTAYAHMYRFAKGIRKGTKVRQGQVIGRVGSTGLSSGPHLHFEVLVNNRHVDPMKIKVPSGRDLKGRELQLFQKERARIDELMRRSPVKTRVSPLERSASAAATAIEAKSTPLNYSSQEILDMARQK